MPETSLPFSLNSLAMLLERLGYDTCKAQPDDEIIHWEKKARAPKSSKALPSYVTIMKPDRSAKGHQKLVYDRNYVMDFLQTIIGMDAPQTSFRILAVLKITDPEQAKIMQAEPLPLRRAGGGAALN